MTKTIFMRTYIPGVPDSYSGHRPGVFETGITDWYTSAVLYRYMAYKAINESIGKFMQGKTTESLMLKISCRQGKRG